MELNERVLRTAWNQSGRVAGVAGRYVEREDTYQEIVIGLLEAGEEQIADWQERRILPIVLYRMGLKYLEDQRVKRTGAERGDFTYYTPSILVDLLPDSWNDHGLLSDGRTNDIARDRGKSKPAESGNRLAMLCDVRDGLRKLTPANRVLLKAMYSEEAIGLEELAKRMGKTDDAVRKQVTRILWRLCDKLGGAPPFYLGGRKAVSNAQAQAMTNHQEDE